MATCGQCQKPFSIEEDERKFYQKNGVPDPKRCHNCKLQRKLAFRNQNKLYKRTCDFSKKNIISCYSQDKPYKIYENEIWWSDKWNPLEYGRAFDFSRPFFEQFQELKLQVPRIPLHAVNNENAEYVSLTGYCKNSYLLFASEYDEDCLYGTQVIKSNSCIDTLNCYESEFCYEVVDTEKCYELFFSLDCVGCSESMFLADCRNCSNCLFSTNLRNKQYYIFNKACSREDYAKKKQEILDEMARGNLNKLLKQFDELRLKKMIHRDLIINHCVNSFGDYIFESKNAKYCFDLTKGQDCQYVFTGFNVKDLMDVAHTTDAELGYETTSFGYNSYNVFFANGACGTSNSRYVENVHHSDNLFGCTGLKRNKYCILNKQYTKEGYEKMLPRIIEHMRKTDEYGEFFPIKHSPYAYNETLAQEYFPLDKEQAQKLGASWMEENKHDYLKQTYQVPFDIKKVSDQILGEILSCRDCGKNYRIISKELNFYRKMGLTIPIKCPDCRHATRFKYKNPRKIWKRSCSKCNKEIRTTFSPERPETVYCEKCYLEAVY